MSRASKYQAKQADVDGFIYYSDEEHAVWHELLTTQLSLFPGRMCDQYLAGLKIIDLPRKNIPQIYEVNEHLLPISGWRVQAVPALINFDKFFSLLS